VSESTYSFVLGSVGGILLGLFWIDVWRAVRAGVRALEAFTAAQTPLSHAALEQLRAYDPEYQLAREEAELLADVESGRVSLTPAEVGQLRERVEARKARAA